MKQEKSKGKFKQIIPAPMIPGFTCMNSVNKKQRAFVPRFAHNLLAGASIRNIRSMPPIFFGRP
jgi:hypothetical protein